MGPVICMSEKEKAPRFLELSEQMQRAFDQGEFRLAFDLGRQILSKEPGHWRASYLIASIKSLPLPEFFDADGALEIISAAIKANPEDHKRQLGLAEVQTSCGMYAEAADVYGRVLKRSPDCCEALVGLALLQGHPGVRLSLAEAEHLLTHAIETSPTSGEALYYLGAHKRKAGRLLEAKSHFARALSLLPHESPIRAAAEDALRGFHS
jgi:tetratricopeptide (TPR) repeat protein